MNIKLDDLNINKNKLLKKINNLHYQEALDILKNAVDEDTALNILFKEFDLLDPIRKLNSEYHNEFREELENLWKLLYRISIFINILETNDNYIPIINKYFPFSIDLIFDDNCRGGIIYNGFEFFAKVYKSYINNDYTALSYALDTSSIEKDLLDNVFLRYLEAIYFEDKYDDMECCITFCLSYQHYQESSSFGKLLNEISKFRQEMSTINSRKALFEGNITEFERKRDDYEFIF